MHCRGKWHGRRTQGKKWKLRPAECGLPFTKVGLLSITALDRTAIADQQSASLQRLPRLESERLGDVEVVRGMACQVSAHDVDCIRAWRLSQVTILTTKNPKTSTAEYEMGLAAGLSPH